MQGSFQRDSDTSTYRLIVSGWFTIVIPTLTTSGIWAGVFLVPLALLGWNAHDWLGMLLCFGGFIPGLAAAWATHQLLLRLDERGRGELVLEDDCLRWRAGRRWQGIDFTQSPPASLPPHPPH